MADNIDVTPGTGATVAADDVGGALHQRVKVEWGGDGTVNETDTATGKPLPIQVRSATGLIPLGEPTDAKSTATDGTSASAIAILKQISASLQTPAVPATRGYTARVSITRPSDTTAYAAGDVVGVTGGGTGCITFANMRDVAGEILITSATFERDVAALISGETSYTLHLYNVTQPGAQVDNAVFDLPSGDRASYLGSLNLGTPVDLGSTLYIATDGINKQVTLASTSLFGVLVTVGAYTPASASVHVVTLHAVAV